MEVSSWAGIGPCGVGQKSKMADTKQQEPTATQDNMADGKSTKCH